MGIRMKKNNRKVDIIIIIVLVLLIAAAILIPLLTSRQDANNKQQDISELTVADFADKNIGVVTGTLFEGFVKEHYPSAVISYYNGVPDLTQALTSGKIDAFLLGDDSAAALESENPQIKHLNDKAGTFDEGIVFPKTAAGDKIRGQMDEFITKLKADGTLDKIIAFWQTEEARSTPADMSGLTGENGTLRYVTSGNEVPGSFIVDDQPAGLDPDLAVRFCREYGYNIDITITDFAGVIPGIVTGMYDFAGNEIVITPERKESVNFSVPYITSDVYMMVLDGSAVPTVTFSDYNGKPFGVVTGTVFEEVTRENFPDSEMSYYNSISDLAIALKQNKIDAFLCDEPVVRVLCNEHKELSYLKQMLMNDDYAFAFQKNNDKCEKLREQFNELLAKYKADGTLDALIEIWTGEDESKKVVDMNFTGENGTIQVVTSSTNMPFSYIKENKLVGYAIDLAARFCREYGYDMDIEDVDMSAEIPALTSGKCEMLADSLSVTEERKDSVLFSDTFYKGGISMVVRAEDLGEVDDSNEFVKIGKRIAESFEKNFIREDRWKLIVEGIFTTMLITVASVIAGSLLAFGICMFRRTGSRLAIGISRIYVKLMQGTPMVVLLMILYYIVFGKSGMEAVWVAIIGFSLNFGAYASEIMRSGIESIDGGQREAALALGYSESQAFFRFIFPQAAGRFMPVYNQEIVSLLKGTSIVGYIAIQDLTKMGDIIRSRTYEAFFPLIVTAVIYFILAWILSLLLKLIAKQITPKRKKKNAA